MHVDARDSGKLGLTRREAIGIVSTIVLGTALAGAGFQASAQEGKPVVYLHYEADGAVFDARVLDMDTAAPTLDLVVSATGEGLLVAGIEVQLHPIMADGSSSYDILLGISFGDMPMRCGETRRSTYVMEMGSALASLECVDVSVTSGRIVWAGEGLELYARKEKPSRNPNEILFAVAAQASIAQVSSLVVHARVWDGDGQEIDAPDLTLVAQGSEPLTLLGTAAVKTAYLPWPENAADWSVESAEAKVETGLGVAPVVKLGCWPPAKEDGAALSGGPSQTAASQLDDTLAPGEGLSSRQASPERIEWYVIAQENTRRLLLSKRVIDCLPFDERGDGVTWEECTLRSWLNDEFFNGAFSWQEWPRVMPTDLANSSNPDFSFVLCGSVTRDRVFCLSLQEVERYLDVPQEEWSDGKREPGAHLELVAEPTDWAILRGVGAGREAADEGDGATCLTEGCDWWLRSPGSAEGSAAVVSACGNVCSEGCDARADRIGIRPALWQDIEVLTY